MFWGQHLHSKPWDVPLEWNGEDAVTQALHAVEDFGKLDRTIAEKLKKQGEIQSNIHTGRCGKRENSAWGIRTTIHHTGGDHVITKSMKQLGSVWRSIIDIVATFKPWWGE